MRIHEAVPDPDNLLALATEDLALIVLEYLTSLPLFERTSLRRGNFLLVGTYKEFPDAYHKRIRIALAESWAWLERELLIAPDPEAQERDLIFVTRRGEALVDGGDFEAFKKGRLLPRELLDPALDQKAFPPFLRGDYDVAVFQAFKELEVAVRTVGGFAQTDLGVDLMRKAFNTQNGPLTNQSSPPGEKQAASDLFAGAVGYCKNPTSHRNVTMGALEAVELILLANHLLRTVKNRVATNP